MTEADRFLVFLKAVHPEIGASVSLEDIGCNAASMTNFVFIPLEEREKKILSQRFGLLAYGRQHTLKEIGATEGVTIERIRQIEMKALRKCRFALGKTLGKIARACSY